MLPIGRNFWADWYRFIPFENTPDTPNLTPDLLKVYVFLFLASCSCSFSTKTFDMSYFIDIPRSPRPEWLVMVIFSYFVPYFVVSVALHLKLLNVRVAMYLLKVVCGLFLVAW